MAHDTDVSHEDLLKAVIGHQKKSLSEDIDVNDFLPHLYQARVIERATEDKIRARLKTEGETGAASLFWSMVLRDEIPVLRFLEVMRKEEHWICDKLEQGVPKVKSGEWPLHGEPDLKSRLMYYFSH